MANMLGIVLWCMFGFIVIRIGMRGFTAQGVQIMGKVITGRRSKFVGALFIVLGLLAFAFSFYRLLFQFSRHAL